MLIFVVIVTILVFFVVIVPVVLLVVGVVAVAVVVVVVVVVIICLVVIVDVVHLNHCCNVVCIVFVFKIPRNAIFPAVREIFPIVSPKTPLFDFFCLFLFSHFSYFLFTLMIFSHFSPFFLHFVFCCSFPIPFQTIFIFVFFGLLIFYVCCCLFVFCFFHAKVVGLTFPVLNSSCFSL